MQHMRKLVLLIITPIMFLSVVAYSATASASPPPPSTPAPTAPKPRGPSQIQRKYSPQSSGPQTVAPQVDINCNEQSTVTNYGGGSVGWGGFTSCDVSMPYLLVISHLDLYDPITGEWIEDVRSPASDSCGGCGFEAANSVDTLGTGRYDVRVEHKNIAPPGYYPPNSDDFTFLEFSVP